LKSSAGLILSWRSVAIFAIVFSAGYLVSVGYVQNPAATPAEQMVTPALASPAQDEGTGEFVLAPDITLKKLEGGTVKLTDYRGKWVFLNLWATWCPPCIYEMPSMEKFYQKFKSKNLAIFAVSLDTADSKQAVIDFVIEKNLTFDIFLDPDNVTLRKFKTMSLPSTYVINPEGYIVSQAMGARDWNDPVIIEYFTDLMSIDKKEIL
jgi:peroxiredoxin